MDSLEALEAFLRANEGKTLDKKMIFAIAKCCSSIQDDLFYLMECTDRAIRNNVSAEMAVHDITVELMLKCREYEVSLPVVPREKHI